MGTVSLTSIESTGFLYTDFTQIKQQLDGLDDSKTLENRISTNETNISTNTTNITNKMSDLVDDTSPELGGELDAGAHAIGFTLQTATGDGTTTIDWKLGNKFKFTFGAQNETFTFTAPSNPCSLTLILVQDSTGSRTVTWPATVKWPDGTAPTLSTAANSVDIVSLLYDGTNYYGSSALNFS